MSKSLSQAKDELAYIDTVEGLRNLVRDTSAKVEGAADDVTSLLYGGAVYGNPSPSVAAVLTAGTVSHNGTDRLVRVDGSSAGKLLFSDEFTSKLDKVVGAHLEQSVSNFNALSEVDQLRLKKEFINQAVYGKDTQGNRLPVDPANPSMWDVASTNFVNQATGNFRIVAGAVSDSSILMQIELPALVARSDDFQVIRRDPLILDLDGEGMEFLGASRWRVFDHSAGAAPAGRTGQVLPDGAWMYSVSPPNAHVDLLNQAYAALRHSVYRALVLKTQPGADLVNAACLRGKGITGNASQWLVCA